MSTSGQPQHTQSPSTDPKCILTVARGVAPEGRNTRAGGALGLNAHSSSLSLDNNCSQIHLIYIL